MRVALLLACLFFSFVLANDVNLYQTCTYGGAFYSDPASYWWWSSSLPADAASLALPASEYYSYTLDDGSIVYANVCTGSKICEGGLACIISPLGTNKIYAYPNSSPYYYTYNSNALELSYHIHTPSYRSVEFQVVCGPTAEITSVTFDDDDYMNIYMSSPDICYSSSVETYTAPKNYTSLTAPIFLTGTLPMFSVDAVSLEGTSNTFVGTLYYSSIYSSFKMEGTLSNNNGESSNVAYLYSGNQPLDNPPIIVSLVTPPGRSDPLCILLPIPLGSDDDDLEVDWFGVHSYHNDYQSLSRNYTSVYFEKGNTFPVTVYANKNQPKVTLMETQSGGLPVFVGIESIAPFLGSDSENYPIMISELDWNTVDTSPLDKSLFDLPSDWNCKK